MQRKTKKILLTLLPLLAVLVITAITLSSCSGPIEGLNPEAIINQLFPNVWVFIGQLISMSVLFCVIVFFIWKPTNKMLDNRRQLIEAELQEGKKLQEEANAVLENAQNLQADAKEKANAILSQANIKSDEILKAAFETAKQEKEKIISDANAQAIRDVNKMKNDAELEIIDTAFKAAEVLMKKEISKKDNEKFVKDFIANL